MSSSEIDSLKKEKMENKNYSLRQTEEDGRPVVISVLRHARAVGVAGVDPSRLDAPCCVDPLKPRRDCGMPPTDLHGTHQTTNGRIAFPLKKTERKKIMVNCVDPSEIQTSKL